MKNLCIILFLAVSITRVYSQNKIENQLDSLFRFLYKNRQFNGNVLVADKGNVIYKKSFGFADFSNNKPVQDSSCFSIGSIAKVFTSTAILQLLEKDKVDLNEYFVHYFSNFPYSDIKIRHLLSHTSGLPDYELYGALVDQHPEKIFNNNDVIPALLEWQKPIYFTPGDKWQYSNTNFNLLALLVEKVSGMPFTDYVTKYIFKKAKMGNTFFLNESTKFTNKYSVTNYQFPALFSSEPIDVNKIEKLRWRVYNLSGFTGQGNIISTTGDLLKFDQALYSGKLLKPESMEKAFTPTILNNGEIVKTNIGIGDASYGLGWFIFSETSAGKIIWHTGGVPGGLSIFIRNIDKKQTVVVFDNTFDEGVYRDGVNAMKILNGQPIDKVKKMIVQEYGSTLVKNGIDEAYCRLVALRADSVHFYLSESQMNLLGYQLLYETNYEGHIQFACEVFKINTLLFPKSSNVYDSYGEGLLKAGKKELAIQMYHKSLEINPENEESINALKKILDD